MKRIFCIIIAIMMLISITSCSSTVNDNEQSEKPNNSQKIDSSNTDNKQSYHSNIEEYATYDHEEGRYVYFNLNSPIEIIPNMPYSSIEEISLADGKDVMESIGDYYESLDWRIRINDTGLVKEVRCNAANQDVDIKWIGNRYEGDSFIGSEFQSIYYENNGEYARIVVQVDNYLTSNENMMDTDTKYYSEFLTNASGMKIDEKVVESALLYAVNNMIENEIAGGVSRYVVILAGEENSSNNNYRLTVTAHVDDDGDQNVSMTLWAFWWF